jgi:hypothetical protein
MPGINQMSSTEYENQYYQWLGSVWITRGDSAPIAIDMVAAADGISLAMLRLSTSVGHPA